MSQLAQELSELQAVPLSEAQMCIDCEAISNTRANACPACGCKSLWRLERWLEKLNGEAA